MTTPPLNSQAVPLATFAALLVQNLAVIDALVAALTVPVAAEVALPTFTTEALAAIPSFTAGYPANGFWIGRDGTIQQPPLADMATFTDQNFGASLLVLGLG